MSVLINSKKWLLVANASEARCYELIRFGQELGLVKEYLHPESRLKSMDLVTDRPGNNLNQRLGLGGGMETEDTKEVEAQRFAHLVSEELFLAKANHQYDKLILIAPPHFLGLLSKRFDKTVAQTICHKIEKDYTKYSLKELIEFTKELPRT